MKDSRLTHALGVIVVSACISPAHAVTFSGEYVSGDFTSTLSTGMGMRLTNPSSSQIIVGNDGGPPGRVAPYAVGDQGDLNYGRGDLFTQYVKGTHELMLRFPEEFTFMARGTWTRDFAATDTTGWTSAQTLDTTAPGAVSNGLTKDAKDELRFNARLLDLWVSKSFRLGDQLARVRVGNQVINWGETLFATDGINQTNSVDIQRISTPGTPLKEALIPAPIISFATGLGNGLNLEAYVQTGWNPHEMPPTGSYWSVGNGAGIGHREYGLVDEDAKDSGQWGISLRYDVSGLPLSLGAYVMRYHEKIFQFSYNADGHGGVGFTYPEDLMLYGLSANAALGDWAVASELSYRPEAPITLNSMTGCVAQNGDCWVEGKRWQWSVNGLLSLTPSNARDFLDFIGADTGTLLSELVVIHYPDLERSYDGTPIASGGYAWGNEADPTAEPRAVGSRTSSGLSLDFSVTYDGSLIPGWQVTPEIYYSHALSGRTPTLMANYMNGTQSANFIVTFTQNPLTWQAGVNYARYWGGDSVFDQPFADRDFVGAYVSYNF